MYKEIVPFLRCPLCRNGLTLHDACQSGGDIVEGALHCRNGHSFRIHEGVADFNSSEQGFANQWESIADGQSFEDADLCMNGQNPAEAAQRQHLVLHALTEAVSARSTRVVLDIASGRGLLLTQLAQHLPEDAHIISIDLSAFVLRYDRHKLKQVAPHRKISFLACNATCLPLKDNMVDSAVTYCGFSNMLGCAGDAMQEAHRVLQPGGMLADSFVIIEENSRGYETLCQVCSEQQLSGAEEFFLHDNLAQQHRALFSAVQCNTVFEGIGVDNGMDLLPYADEWYAEQVFVSTK